MDIGTNNRIARVVVVVGLAVLSVPAHADWTGKGEGGLLLSRGNADSTAANAKLATPLAIEPLLDEE